MWPIITPVTHVTMQLEAATSSWLIPPPLLLLTLWWIPMLGQALGIDTITTTSTMTTRNLQLHCCYTCWGMWAMLLLHRFIFTQFLGVFNIWTFIWKLTFIAFMPLLHLAVRPRFYSLIWDRKSHRSGGEGLHVAQVHSHLILGHFQCLTIHSKAYNCGFQELIAFRRSTQFWFTNSRLEKPWEV